jgi:cytochrome c oxidase assembly protein subunit 11
MKNNKETAITILLIVLGMFAFSYAAFPLYSIFCKATGFGGTPKTGGGASRQLGKRAFTIRFNADVSRDMPWQFMPLQKQISVQTGENKMAFFSAQNKSDKTITGVASYNIAPDAAGQYFHKIQCFCFNKQTLNPGQIVEMPVSFYVDPAIENDLDLQDVNAITLSYTFFMADKK